MQKKYQSPYQILAEFIRYIIAEDSIYSFHGIEMKNKLNDYFGFVIPESVLKTTLKKMAGITKRDGTYAVSVDVIGTDSLFEEKKKEAEIVNSDILNALHEYVCTKSTALNVSYETLTQELIAFLIDEQECSSLGYSVLIGEFILKNQNDKKIQGALNRIREGSILYIGLNYDIKETGSIKRPLTLYLGTEILFSIAGLNGEIHRQLAEDFYKQVFLANSEKNSAKKKIVLCYFDDVKKEIDLYFAVAEEIVERRRAYIPGKPAMKSIVNGCSTAGDVRIKKADFYHSLQSKYGIIQDHHEDYYDKDYFKDNIESFDDLNADDKHYEMGMKFVSHINKLREGKSFDNDLDSGFLLVTNTKSILNISSKTAESFKNKDDRNHVSNLAVSLNRITNLLWYKLGNGFGSKKYPASVSAVLRARVVLSSSIARNAEKVFSESKKQFQSGEISKEQLFARICTLIDKPKLPEELDGGNIDSVMDFSPEYMSRFEEQIKIDRKSLEEQERIIELMKAENRRSNAQKDATIAAQADMLAEKDKIIAESHNELIEHRKEKAKQLRRKIILKIMTHFLMSSILVCLIIFIVYIICESLNPSLTMTISGGIGVVSTVCNAISAFRRYMKAHLVNVNAHHDGILHRDDS